MNRAIIEAKLQSLDKQTLIDLLLDNGIDRAFGVMTRNFAELFHSEIEAGHTLVMIDIANMHKLNHLLGMACVDELIDFVLSQFRMTDFWVRWGGDEIVVILRDTADFVGFIDRFDAAMKAANMYAVYGIVTTSNSLKESVKRADDIVMAMKNQLESHGLKAGRDDDYIRLTSMVVSE